MAISLICLISSPLLCCRYYYRCTYKDNMNCPATKQVQQKDHNDPPLYAVTYYNEP